MIQKKRGIRNSTLLAGFLALALLAIAFLHLCLFPIGHEEDCDSTHHCLLCTIFGFTILAIFLSDLFASPLIVHLPLSLEPICSGSRSVLISVPVRAPPLTRLS
jgi:hypothetical protein